MKWDTATVISMVFGLCSMAIVMFFVYYAMVPDDLYCLDTSGGEQICVEGK